MLMAAAHTGPGTLQYFGGLLLGSAVSPALLRRHLMVWKMFVSRYMLHAIELLCADDAVLVGLWFGDGRIVMSDRVFALPAPRAGGSIEGNNRRRW